MTSPAAGKRRKDQDVIRLIESKHDVEIMDSLKHFMVRFNGPSDTPYEGGVWKIRVMLPDDYQKAKTAVLFLGTAFKSPSIGFINRIFHPNIDEASGTVCLDVINQTWTPVFDLVNVFESFLPQLLTYPNPADPLNGEAASMLMSRPTEYERRVRECVKKYATPEAFSNICDRGTPLHSAHGPPPSIRSQQRSSVSGGAIATSGFTTTASGTRNSTGGGAGLGIAVGRGGAAGSSGGGSVVVAAGIISSSMPPAVNFGRGRGLTSTVVQQSQNASAVQQQQPTTTTSTISSTSDSVHVAGGSSVFVSNLTVPSVGSANSTVQSSNGSVTTIANRNPPPPDPDAEFVNGDDNDNDDVDDDGEASDLSEFSENEADQMDL